MSEEEPKVAEKPIEKPKPNCIVVPEHIKPLLECCRDFEEGKIDDSEFFARTLVRTGEYMQNVKKNRSQPKSE